MVLARVNKHKLLAILIDPDKFNSNNTVPFLQKIPKKTTHLFIGGSTVKHGLTEQLIEKLKSVTEKPILIFPGDVAQITHKADALLFLILLSGRNPEYLIGQQIRAVSKIRENPLQVISTGYILIDGGNRSAVSEVTLTQPIPQNEVQRIVDTAKAGRTNRKQTNVPRSGQWSYYPCF